MQCLLQELRSFVQYAQYLGSPLGGGVREDSSESQRIIGGEGFISELNVSAEGEYKILCCLVDMPLQQAGVTPLTLKIGLAGRQA